jgi:hypothetical protein
MSDYTDLAAHLEELERELHVHVIRVSARASELLADDFVEFGRSGRVFNKESIIAAMAQEAPGPRLSTATDFKVVNISTDAALVTYRTIQNAEPKIFSLHSSIWRRHNDRWQMMFHQGTHGPVPNEGEL